MEPTLWEGGDFLKLSPQNAGHLISNGHWATQKGKPNKRLNADEYKKLYLEVLKHAEKY